jgi:hypothetical protein
LRQVGGDHLDVPAGGDGSSSCSSIATVYGSSPVEQPALQTRSGAVRRRGADQLGQHAVAQRRICGGLRKK